LVYFVVGGVAIGIGILGTLAAAGGAVGAGQVGGAFLDLGGLFVVLGLAVRLLGALEQRLIDVQRAVIWAAPEPASSEGRPRG
jgi:hypothetical protein